MIAMHVHTTEAGAIPASGFREPCTPEAQLIADRVYGAAGGSRRGIDGRT